MLSKVLSYALSGVDGFPVTVETFVSAGLFSYDTVGLPDTAVKESRERVRSAIVKFVPKFISNSAFK